MVKEPLYQAIRDFLERPDIKEILPELTGYQKTQEGIREK